MAPRIGSVLHNRSEHAVIAGDDDVLLLAAIAARALKWPDALVDALDDTMSILSLGAAGLEHINVLLRSAMAEGQLMREVGAVVTFAEAKFGPPVRPSKVIGIAGNYGDVRRDYSAAPEWLPIFQKAPSALVGHGGVVELPSDSRYVQPEAEMCLVIGRRARNVTVEDGARAIAGYTVGNDVTDIDRMLHSWVFRKRPDLEALGLGAGYPLNFGLAFEAKSADTFAPLGPLVQLGEDGSEDMELSLEINGSVEQQCRTGDLIVSGAELVSRLSRVCTLEVGDVIFTGASGQLPALRAGDRLVHRIGELPALVVGVTSAAT